ncbi:TBC1 domain family member 1 [Aplysia californica]|uniref:TBC1 domain family member 1 n=1 Tax=Aplysia californica TaxID=6500 RepID=A0ABM0K4B6_APLCA|nr:TBC1 domain family member 1 [Aplysia californica]
MAGGQKKPAALHMDFYSDSDSSRGNLSINEEATGGGGSGSGQTLASSSGQSYQDVFSQARQQQTASPTAGPGRRRHGSNTDENSPGGAANKTSTQGSEVSLGRLRHPSGDGEDAGQSGGGSGMPGAPPHTANRIMVLQISQQDISLICLEKKTPILERYFKDISFVSQGSHKQEVFGIVVRESSSMFICYLVKCLTDSVVSEIMSTLQTAFTAAYSKTGSTAGGGAGGGTGGSSGTAGNTPVTPTTPGTAPNELCTSCPLHQLHRLCQEITTDSSTKDGHTCPDDGTKITNCDYSENGTSLQINASL